MDLNLYLGLPRSPIGRGSDLGSDLALALIPLSAEETGSNQLSGFMPASDSHARYSPTHASYTPNLPPIEPLDPTEEPQIPRFDIAPYTPSLPFYGLVPPSLAQNSPEPNGSSRLEYCPHLPSYIPVSPTTDRTGVEPRGPDVSDPVGHAPYSPSYPPVSPAAEDIIRPVIEGGSNRVEHVPYSQAVDAFVLEDGDSHVPYSPPYVPASLTQQVPNDRPNGGSPLPAVALSLFDATMQTGEPLSLDGPSQRELFRYPEVRLRRLIESSRRWRSTVPYRAEPDFGMSSLTMEDRLVQDIMTTERSVGTSATHKVSAESLIAKDSEEEKEEQGRAAANFECNVCLDMARDPVVTSCGHLFCWPCLYQRLHVYCDYKECPVCKGEVTESNITPIYGRGSTETAAKKKGGEDGDSSLKVPPRPHGRRFESSRQLHPRPPSRRLGEQFRSWRRILDEEKRNGNRLDGEESSQPGIFDGPSCRVPTKLMAGQQFRREGSSENGLNLGASGSSRNVTDPGSSQNGNSDVDGTHVGHRSALLRDKIDFWHRFALYSLPGADGFADISARFSSFLERTANNVNHSGASASANPQYSEPLHGKGTQGATSAADQASASSTMAVIQRDASADGFAWRGAHCSAYDKNPDDQVRPTVVPDDVIQPESDKSWAPHPKTGVFASSEQNGRAGGDHRPPSVNGSVLEEKTWFRPLEDVDKPHPSKKDENSVGLLPWRKWGPQSL